MLPKYRMTRGRPQISGYRLLRLQVLPRRHPRAPTAVPFEFAGLELGCHIAGSSTSAMFGGGRLVLISCRDQLKS
jgi:hypothetical protein